MTSDLSLAAVTVWRLVSHDRRAARKPRRRFLFQMEQILARASAAGVASGYLKANCANRTIRAEIIRTSIAAFYLDLNQCKNTNGNYNSKCMLNNMHNSIKTIILRSVSCVYQKTSSNSFPTSQRS